MPSWLREEIIKMKAAIGSSAPEVSRQDAESNEDELMGPKGDWVGGKSMDSTRSTEEEGGDEDYVEEARTIKVNQEIKRILTEVLLKVTDDLFDEIAINVLEEDDLGVEVERKAESAPAVITPKSTTKVIIPANTKGADVGDANYKVVVYSAVVMISTQKKKTGVIAPKRFVQRAKKENELFRSYMHRVHSGFTHVNCSVSHHFAWMRDLVDILKKETTKGPAEGLSPPQKDR